MSIEQTITVATGYLELGMAYDALYELECLAWSDRNRRDVLDLKLSAQMETGQWNLASETARLLCMKATDEPTYFLDAAFCLHETGDTSAACSWLMRGPRALNDMALFHYNMACYLWTLGEADRARTHLRRALVMDEGLIEEACCDSDLVGMEPVI